MYLLGTICNLYLITLNVNLEIDQENKHFRCKSTRYQYRYSRNNILHTTNCVKSKMT